MFLLSRTEDLYNTREKVESIRKCPPATETAEEKYRSADDELREENKA